MAASRKKVIVRTHEGAVHAGHLPQARLLNGAKEVELLDLGGRITPIPLQNVRWIAFVRDFNLNDVIDPERLARRTFLARPRTEGLWLRLTMRTGEALEGLAPIDLSLVDGLLDDRGVYFIPPDIRSNTQRLFVPRTSFIDMQLLAVITNPSRVKPIAEVKTPQPTLFPD